MTRTLPGILLLIALLAGCSWSRDGGPSHSADLSHVPDIVPRAEPRSRGGNPASYIVNGRRYIVRSSSAGYVERGIASWYGKKFHGRKTSNGETYDMHAFSAAHTTLPLPTYARVTNLNNGRSTVVRINDRGPFHDNRLIDLSYAAASKLGIVENGTGLVEVRALTPGETAPPSTFLASKTKGARIYLQAGAFAKRNNAEQLHARLSRARYTPLHIQQASSNRQTLYRVRIGPINSVAEADKIAKRLHSQGFGTPHVLID